MTSAEYLNIIRSFLKDELRVPDNLTDKYIPSSQSEPVFFRQMKKSNIIPQNKIDLSKKSGETHIYIPKEYSGFFYSAEEQKAFLEDSNTRERKQNFVFFEADISYMLKRRSSAQESDESLHPLTSRKNHSLLNISKGYAISWMSSHNGDVQVQLGKSMQDDDNFYDFRAGILIDDYLILFRCPDKESIFAISIPSQYVESFRINSFNLLKESALDDFLYNFKVNFYPGLSSKTTEISPAPPNLPETDGNREIYVSDPELGKGAIEKNNYSCMVCGKHAFSGEKQIHYYMEVHHLIPMEYQYRFSAGLDITPNIIPLCPDCHKIIHYGDNESRKKILTSLFEKQKNALVHCGLRISLDQLLDLYNPK